MMGSLPLHIACFILLNLAIVLLGYVLVRKKMVSISWLLLVLSIAGIDLIFLHNNPIIRMLAIIATTFTAMKVIAVAESYKTTAMPLNLKQWTVFATGWAGMRAQSFETLGGTPLPGAWPMIRFGISRVAAGLLLILSAHFIISLSLTPIFTHILVTAILLVGFSLVLHFGLLGISAGSWRLSGANTYVLFRQPAKAASLTELWSKRWNVAFSEMTAVAVFRPLKSRVGSAMALMASFIFSGLLHELALSLPVNSGYGLPTLYFAIQGVMVLVEKALSNNNVSFLKNKVTARIWVFFWLVVPMPLLFHAEFIRQVLWPMAGLKFYP